MWCCITCPYQLVNLTLIKELWQQCHVHCRDWNFVHLRWWAKWTEFGSQLSPCHENGSSGIKMYEVWSVLVFRHQDSSLCVLKNVTSLHPVAAHHHLFSDASMLAYTPLLLTWAVLPTNISCDAVKTNGSECSSAFRRWYGSVSLHSTIVRNVRAAYDAAEK